MRTVGKTLLLLAVLLSLLPVMIVGRAFQLSTQLYRDTKGSWMPAAYAYANPRAFFVAAGLAGLAWVGFMAGDRGFLRAYFPRIRFFVPKSLSFRWPLAAIVTFRGKHFFAFVGRT